MSAVTQYNRTVETQYRIDVFRWAWGARVATGCESFPQHSSVRMFEFSLTVLLRVLPVPSVHFVASTPSPLRLLPLPHRMAVLELYGWVGARRRSNRVCLISAGYFRHPDIKNDKEGNRLIPRKMIEGLNETYEDGISPTLELPQNDSNPMMDVYKLMLQDNEQPEVAASLIPDEEVAIGSDTTHADKGTVKLKTHTRPVDNGRDGFALLYPEVPESKTTYASLNAGNGALYLGGLGINKGFRMILNAANENSNGYEQFHKEMLRLYKESDKDASKTGTLKQWSELSGGGQILTKPGTSRWYTRWDRMEGTMSIKFRRGFSYSRITVSMHEVPVALFVNSRTNVGCGP
eukprot:GHVU01093809.1.p1 GENE.GHVU01093809.1~~GHVU01093809.1.p1  ORF type:complete len:348 (+),score=33.56 GHVU01093809.1:798-1841(+)